MVQAHPHAPRPAEPLTSVAGTSVAADAVVVGAGTAGLGAAVQLARRGMRVVVLERKRMGEGGARWDNGVLAWQFTRAGFAPPAGPEVRSGTGRTHMRGPGGAGPVVLDGTPTIAADMRKLNDRLAALASELGVQVFDRCTELSVEEHDDRLVAVTTVAAAHDSGAGPAPLRLEAALFVDASGRRGALRSAVGALAGWCPPVEGPELCTASQFSFDVADPDGAKRYVFDHGADPGDGLTWVGLDGGFSALAVDVSADLDEVSILTGTLATGRWGTGRTILDRFLADNPWVGGRRFGGAGLIPLRRPYARLGAPGLALVGDAACQVFPAHGSGIGVGLIAGTILAESVAGAADPGSAEAVWAYQTAFHRELGGTLCAYDAFRRLSTRIGSDGVERMFTSGLFSAEMAVAGLQQRWTEPDRHQVAAAVRAYRSDPGLAARMLPGLARSGAAERLGSAAPASPDLRALRRWDRRVAAVVGG